MKEGIILSIYLNYWFYFNRIKWNLFSKLKDEGMVILFAYKKVKKMSTEDCIKYQIELDKTSKAYKIGYADGDYWNGSQNPYSPELFPRNYLDYEQGFRQCKEDKRKNGVESFIQDQLAKHK